MGEKSSPRRRGTKLRTTRTRSTSAAHEVQCEVHTQTGLTRVEHQCSDTGTVIVVVATPAAAAVGADDDDDDAYVMLKIECSVLVGRSWLGAALSAATMIGIATVTKRSNEPLKTHSNNSKRNCRSAIKTQSNVPGTVPLTQCKTSAS